MKKDKKLQADEKYKELTQKLAAFPGLASGDMSKKLKALEREEARVTVKFQETDQKVKDIKKQLEEAWYQHDHAVQQKRNAQPYLDVIAELDKKKAVLEKELEPVRARRNQLKDEIKKIQSGAKEIENELGKMTGERDKWIRVKENVTFRRFRSHELLQNPQDPASFSR